jgi:hypothetical protein
LLRPEILSAIIFTVAIAPKIEKASNRSSSMMLKGRLAMNIFMVPALKGVAYCQAIL